MLALLQKWASSSCHFPRLLRNAQSNASENWKRTKSSTAKRDWNRLSLCKLHFTDQYTQIKEQNYLRGHFENASRLCSISAERTRPWNWFCDDLISSWLADAQIKQTDSQSLCGNVADGVTANTRARSLLDATKLRGGVNKSNGARWRFCTKGSKVSSRLNTPSLWPRLFISAPLKGTCNSKCRTHNKVHELCMSLNHTSFSSHTWCTSHGHRKPHFIVRFTSFFCSCIFAFNVYLTRLQNLLKSLRFILKYIYCVSALGTVTTSKTCKKHKCKAKCD